MDSNNARATSDKAFEDFLDTFGIKSVEFKRRKVYKFETGDIAGLLAGMTECHEKIYRILLATHMSCIPPEDRIENIEKFRSFVNGYLDRATSEFTEAHSNGEAIGSAFGVVK